MNDRPSDSAPSGDGDLAPGTRTIRDVARLAGVSIGTVSKALNANGRLSAETRARVLKIARAIDYRPNDLAQSLHRARSMTVGILSNDSFGRFAFPIVEALERRLSDHGIAVFMCNATDDPARERRHIDQLLGKRVDGLVVTARRADRREPIEPASRGLPVVYVFSQVENPDALCLLPDDEGGARLAVSHLAALGRKRIAHITGPERFEAVRLREMGWRKALAEAGLKAGASDCRPGQWSEAWGREAAQTLFSRHRAMPDALFCGNDQIARGAMDALREMGLGVPDDVAVVGFDNWGVMAEAARPALTSVDMNLDALGRETGASLMEMMGGRALKGGAPLAVLARHSRFMRGASTARREGKSIMRERAYSAVPFADVRIIGPFWRERLETVLKHTIPSQHAKLKEVGILDSLKLPKPVPPLTIPRNSHGFTMQVFWDSDVGKWIEAASYALAHRRDPDIEAKIDAIVDDLARAQSPDGYLNCWYNGREPEKRWTNLRDNHELYNAGHLLEGAVAYFRATGRRKMLDIMERYVDHIAATFGRGPGQKRGYPGHQEIELALVKLYRLTGDRRRLDLASYFIDERGSQPHYFTEEALARGDDPASYWAGTYEYNQSHIPVREQTRVVGHAVRAMYMASAMSDLASELGDDGLKHACEALWRDVTTAQMYVTAGLGPKETNEGFTEPYDLPNETAYAETCASVALIFWAHRMLHLDLDGRYADVMELALFNGALTGLARDGTHYFYSNPLESRGQHRRWEWHVCPCCTMNVSRLVASVAGYAISAREDGVAFHLYGGFETTIRLAGVQVALRETSDYPWVGGVRIDIDPEKPTTFDLKLRIPGWAKEATAAVNGEPIALRPLNGYATIHRLWRKGDAVTLDLTMPAERLYAHPNVRMDVGRAALRRGPLIYCVEEADNPGGPVQTLALPRSTALDAEWRTDLFGGAMILKASAKRLVPSKEPGALYSTEPPAARDASLIALPYHLWANRTPGSMQVWVAELEG